MSTLVTDSLQNTANTASCTIAAIAPIPGALGNSAGYQNSASGSVLRTYSNKAADILCYNDFLPSGTITNHTTYLANAMAAAAATNHTLYIPAGTYPVDNLIIPSTVNLVGDGMGKTVIQRIASAADNNSVASITSSTGNHIMDITFDGNSSNQTNAAHTVVVTGSINIYFERCEFMNSKVVSGGFGNGLLITGGTGTTSVYGFTKVNHCRFHNNGNLDLQLNTTWYYDISHNYFYGSNGGIAIENYVYPPVSDVQDYGIIAYNQIYNQTGNGLWLMGYTLSGGTITAPVFGETTPPSRHVTIIGNVVNLCTSYGIAVQGANFSVVGNTVHNCGSTSGVGAGILFNTWASTLTGNTIRDNANFGCDAGGSVDCSITGNQFQWNGTTAGIAGCVDLNLGAARSVIVTGNEIVQAGSLNMTAIAAPGVDGNGTTPFPTRGSRIVINDNFITLNSNAATVGIYVYRQMNEATVKNNVVNGAQGLNQAYILECSNLNHSGNMDTYWYGSGSVVPNIASAATTLIPDTGESLYITGTTGITSIQTRSSNVYNGAVRDVQISNGGSGYSYSSPPTVTFSGGGGSGAAATAQVDYAGSVVAVSFTSFGSGYTSAPTVTFSAPTSGTTATGTVTIGCTNFEGREISLMFQGACTVTPGSNLCLNGTFTSTANQSILKLRGAYGNWYEVSRCTSAF
jgi:hypothetical protein